MIDELIEALIRYRKENDISQAEVAERYGVNQSRISVIENGDHELHLSTVQKYAEIIGVAVYLLAAPEGSPREKLLELFTSITDEEAKAILETLNSTPRQPALVVEL